MTVEHLAHQLRVERAGGLVEHQHLGLHAQRAGDGDALLLAARQARRVLVALVEQLDLVRYFSAVSMASALGTPLTLVGASMQFSSTVMCGKRLKSWKTMPGLQAQVADLLAVLPAAAVERVGLDA